MRLRPVAVGAVHGLVEPATGRVYVGLRAVAGAAAMNEHEIHHWHIPLAWGCPGEFRWWDVRLWYRLDALSELVGALQDASVRAREEGRLERAEFLVGAAARVDSFAAQVRHELDVSAGKLGWQARWEQARESDGHGEEVRCG